MKRRPALLTMLVMSGLLAGFPGLCAAYCIHGRLNCWHCGSHYVSSYTYSGYGVPGATGVVLQPVQMPPTVTTLPPPPGGVTASNRTVSQSGALNVPGAAIAPIAVSAGVYPVAYSSPYSATYMVSYPVVSQSLPYASAPYTGYEPPSSSTASPSPASPSYLTGVDTNLAEPSPVAAGEAMSPARFAGHLLHRLESRFPQGLVPERQVVLAQTLQFFSEAVPWPWSSLPISTFDRQQVEKLVDRFLQRRPAAQVANGAAPPPPPVASNDSPSSPPNTAGPAIPPTGLRPSSDNPNEIEITFRIKLPSGAKITPK